jgi:hypothetical protein
MSPHWFSLHSAEHVDSVALYKEMFAICRRSPVLGTSRALVVEPATGPSHKRSLGRVIARTKYGDEIVCVSGKECHPQKPTRSAPPSDVPLTEYPKQGGGESHVQKDA